MTAIYINTILNAVKTVFITMLGMPVTFKNPTIKKARNPTYDISSQIKVLGKKNYLLVLSYPKKIAISMASGMLGDEFTDINDELIDVMGEITNMVIGVADTELEMENVTYSLPKVTIEKDKIVYPNNGEVFSMICVMDSGNFEVDIAYKKDSL